MGNEHGMGRYVRPTALTEAVAALAAGDLTVIAGGTDFYPARVGKPLDDDVLDISAIEELRGITDAGDHWRIGATTTWTDLIEAELPACFDGLKLAAREVGGMQIQNMGTIAGNICNASPAADGVPPLLTLDARVELSGQAGVAELPLADFITGNRRTRRGADQLVTAVIVPKPADDSRGHFLKLGSRRYLVISIVMVAGVVALDARRRVASARISVGSCSEVACRLFALEAKLVGQLIDNAIENTVAAADLSALSPIDDCRGTAPYRRDAARTLVRRLLEEAAAA